MTIIAIIAIYIYLVERKKHLKDKRKIANILRKGEQIYGKENDSLSELS